MDDAAILQELERRLKSWLRPADFGWSEENYGFRVVMETIDSLRRDGTAPSWE